MGLILITEEHIVYFINDKIEWEIDTGMIALVEQDGTNVLLHLSDMKKVGEVKLSLKTREAANLMYAKLNNALMNGD